MRIILLGTVLPSNTADVFLKLGVAPPPADNAQRYILSGLKQAHKNDQIVAFCSPRLTAFPKSGIKVVRNDESKEEWGNLHVTGYLNFPLVSFFQRENNLIKTIKRELPKWKDEKVIVLIYSMHSPFLKANYYIKKAISNAKSCLIVPDIPELMTKNNKRFIRSYLKRIDRQRINKLLPYVDCYALYTEAMADYFSIPKGKYIVFEGLVDQSRLEHEDIEKYSKITCLYAGSLNPKYGIKTLINAFSKLSNEYELKIYGKDITGGSINEWCNATNNCKYLGVLSPEEVFLEMKRCHLLINPRPSTLDLTKYSFPSKTFEYMASGTPVVMNHLPGIPNEYDEFLYFFESEDEIGIYNTLNSLLKMDAQSLDRKGKSARQFIRVEKNAVSQTSKIVDLCFRA